MSKNMETMGECNIGGRKGEREKSKMEKRKKMKKRNLVVCLATRRDGGDACPRSDSLDARIGSLCEERLRSACSGSGFL